MGIKLELLSKVIISSSADESYSDDIGERGVIVQMCQLPEEDQPHICVQLDNGSMVGDLIPADLENAPKTLAAFNL